MYPRQTRASASPGSEFPGTSIGIHKRQRSDVAEWVRLGQQSGEIRGDVKPEDVASQYVSYISGMTYLWLINPNSIDFRKANDDMKVHLKISLSPKPSDQ